MKNYRPISLLFFFFPKVFEKTMYTRLSQHLPTNNRQVTERYGFRKGISTKNGALRLKDDDDDDDDDDNNNNNNNNHSF